MNYYKSIKTSDDLILSCDMLRLKFNINQNSLTLINSFIDNIVNNIDKINYSYFRSSSYYNYNHLYNFTLLENNSTFTLGLCLNSLKNIEKQSCFIEFNPNKTLFVGSLLYEFLKKIREVTTGFELSRFDFAIDIPVERSCVTLIKDLRNYKKNYYIDATAINLNNITEYLGTRNKNGFVKLYNKKLEQKLDYDLTRLEITLDNFDYSNFIKQLPQIRYFNSIDLLSQNELNDTDKVLVNLLLSSPNTSLYLSMLGRGKKEKYEKLIYDTKIINVNEFDFFSVIKNINQLIG